MVAAGALFAAGGKTPAASAAPASGRERLATFLGQWESTGTFQDTPFSKAGSVSSKFTCGWSALNEYLICDMSISLPSSQLTVYSFNSESSSYAYCSMNNRDPQAHCGKLLIEGDTWTYDGGGMEDEQGNKVSFRTMNVFDKPGHYTFRVEYSDDGKQWTLMMNGEGHRTK